MKNIAIYGAGGFGRETALLIQEINHRQAEWNFIGFFDDSSELRGTVDGAKVLGGLKSISTFNDLHVVVAIADPAIRQQVIERIRHLSIKFPTVIHPGANMGAASNIVGKGCIITAGTILTTGIQLGDFVIINLSSTIGHDANLSDYVSIMPGCSISGNVRIGERTMIGTGARILQNLKIGKDCRVGAGAVVTTDIRENKTALGVPANERDH